MGVRGGGCGLADGTEMLIEYGLILQQVEYGVATRMACLEAVVATLAGAGK